jgi:hypothetical protein
MSNQLILLDKVLEEYYISGNYKDTSKAFERFATEQIFKDQDMDLEEIEQGLISGNRDGGIDGLYLFVNDEYIVDKDQLPASKQINLEIFLIQYKNSSTIEELVIDRFLGSIRYIFDLTMDKESLSQIFNDNLVQKILFFKEIWIETANRHPKIRVNFIHACKGDKSKTLGPKSINQAYSNKMNRLKLEVLEYGGENFKVSYDIVDANWLLEVNRKEKKYSLNLKLNENPIAIDFKDENQRGYISSVNLFDYFKFITNEDGSLRKYLFESNIRDYQNRTAVNDEITKSVEEENELDFWWLNNGVTIIAEKGSLSGKILHLDNIQIVNGLQTSHTIFKVLKDKRGLESDKRSLMLKIIITQDTLTMDAIIKATNSQNQVPTSSLRATDQIQREIEEYLLTKNYYYDRRKNFYKNEGKPRKNIISISYMSQCLTAIQDRNPSKARSNPTTLIKADNDYKKLFNKGRKLDVYYSVIRIMKHVEGFLRDLTPTDSLEEHISNNYKFHLGRVYVSCLIGKETYTDRELLELDVENLNDKAIENAFTLLKEIVAAYQYEGPKKDIVNISKTISFSDYITKSLLSKL